METPDAERPLGPSQEGSENALLVLRMMANWREPATLGELMALTALDEAALKLTLKGLCWRLRVVKLKGPDKVDRWQLAYLYSQQQQAAAA